MKNYTYNWEIRRMILHFMSALDGGVVKRYDKNQQEVDSIAVNYLYGPKQRIMKDLIDKAEHIKLPIVSVMLTSVNRDSSRVRDNITGRYENLDTYNKETNYEVPSPIPINLTFEVSIMAKYQMDMEQILTNFIPYSDPYIIVSWREPFTNKELRSEIVWDGSINIDTPKELQGTDPYSQISASTSFTFKGYMFKNKETDVGKICVINSDFIVTDKLFCDYNTLLDYATSLDAESFSISGKPIVEWADPQVIKTGSTMPPCTAFTPDVDYDPFEIIGRTEEITIEGKFNNITDIFLSASNPYVFQSETVSSIDIFDGSELYPAFNGILVESFENFVETNKITFNMPILTGGGFIDVIVVNPCGYSKLSTDRRTRISGQTNPYNFGHPLYSGWEKFQDPFVDGIEIIETDLNCVETINVLSTIDGKIIKTLGDYFIVEL